MTATTELTGPAIGQPRTAADTTGSWAGSSTGRRIRSVGLDAFVHDAAVNAAQRTAVTAAAALLAARVAEDAAWSDLAAFGRACLQARTALPHSAAAHARATDAVAQAKRDIAVRALVSLDAAADDAAAQAGLTRALAALVAARERFDGHRAR
jgi:hypothetical protein